MTQRAQLGTQSPYRRTWVFRGALAAYIANVALTISVYGYSMPATLLDIEFSGEGKGTRQGLLLGVTEGYWHILDDDGNIVAVPNASAKGSTVEDKPLKELMTPKALLNIGAEILSFEKVERKIAEKGSPSVTDTDADTDSEIYFTIEQFYAALNMQDYQTAYSYLSADAQELYGSPENYAYDMTQNGYSTYQAHVARLEGVQVSGNTANAIVVVEYNEYNQSSQGRLYRIAYQLVKENGMWKIAQASQQEEVK